MERLSRRYRRLGRPPFFPSPKRGQVDGGPPGLDVVYTPENGHKADIVFVHGLGGASRRTWSKNKKPELFWPLTFLPLEPDLCLARILTFGYDADLRKASNATSTILDFAKSLLYDLKYAKDGQMEDLHMGRVPLIFVVHSMGGLIVKEAYMQGQNDPEYESIIKAVSSITFLATPHRGANLAAILNLILQSAFVTNSKQHLSELATNSINLQKLNEQFRHIAPRLDIVSFYETQPTPIGIKQARVMVLERDSSILGYPGETSKPLDADHHGVCKYESPGDPNYITVRNVLKSLVSKIISTSKSNKLPLSKRTDSHDLKALMAIGEPPYIDYIFFRDQWAEGTGDWVLREKDYLNWLHDQRSRPRLLWLNGGPGTGKSVLSSFIINSLVEQGARCQYFFIRFGDQKKRTLSLLLRSIAYQAAQIVPGFSQKVIEIADEAIDFESADPKIIWERIFKSTLFKIEESQPLYWIIDGLDEADDPRAVVRLLSSVSSSSMPIRIMLLSRKTPEIMDIFQRVPKELNLGTISIEGHLDDLRCYIRQELIMLGTTEFKENIVKRVIERAEDNFLWVRLAVDKLYSCHTQTDVELALEQLPLGMEAQYDRMASSIARIPSPRDKTLAEKILQCVTCSLRAFTVTELSRVLDGDASEMLDFQRSIVDLCRGFVVIDNDGNVMLIHKTVREYLLSGDNHQPFRVDRNAAHKLMFLSCMRCLMTFNLRGKVNSNQKPEFLEYAANSWPSHLASTPLDCEEVVEVLKKFLTRRCFVLTWIQVLAINKNLRALIHAAKYLTRYSTKRREYDAARNDSESQPFKPDQIEDWALDFVKIVGKFGPNLIRNPESIYKLIPPFCPRSSSIYGRFGKKDTENLMVSGLSAGNWDDLLARISPGFGVRASSISAAGAHVAILVPKGGRVFIYDSSIFEEVPASPIKHDERVYRMGFNSPGTLLVTYGYRTTKIWEVSTGKCKIAAKNLESCPRPLTMLLTDNSTTLLVGTDDRRIRSLDLSQTSPSWELVAELDEPEIRGHNFNASNCMALNKDSSLIAVAYRGHPLSAWETDGPVHLGHCWRKRPEKARGEVIQAFWYPGSPEVLGLYIEGVVFKWRPYDGDTEEFATGASRLAMSDDGNLFATGDSHGAVKVFATSDFCLLYQLASQDPVLSLSFSPDSRRFYDIRGDYGNAWEPTSLMRFAGQIGKGADGESETESFAAGNTTSISWSPRVDPITVLACSPAGRLYCCGTENGAVRLHDTKQGKLADIHTSESPLSIGQMCWSHNGQYLCFSDSNKTVFIIPVASSADASDADVGSKVEIPVRSGAEGSILQLLFEPDSRHLLVHTPSMIYTISLESYSVRFSLYLQTAGYKWIIHPRDRALIVGVGPKVIRILNWKLVEHQTYQFEYSLHQSMPSNSESSAPQDTVDRVLVTQDKRRVLVQITLRSQRTKEKVFLSLETSVLKPAVATPNIGQRSEPITIQPISLPKDVSSQIALALSFRSRDHLVFLSRTFSICSWPLSPGSSPPLSGPITRSNPIATTATTSLYHYPHSANPNDTFETMFTQLFSLPTDWINSDCLALCIVWGKEMSLLCPKNGEVAVVRCASLV